MSVIKHAAGRNIHIISPRCNGLDKKRKIIFVTFHLLTEIYQSSPSAVPLLLSPAVRAVPASVFLHIIAIRCQAVFSLFTNRECTRRTA